MSVTFLVSHVNCLLISNKEVHRRLLTHNDCTAGFDVFAEVELRAFCRRTEIFVTTAFRTSIY